MVFGCHLMLLHGKLKLIFQQAFLRQFTINVIVSCICALIFTILLSLDVYKAFKRKAYWILGESLVISALFIQLLSFIDIFNITVNSEDNGLNFYEVEILFDEPLFIESKRVTICVFISYLLPGVVHSGLGTVWGGIGALAFTVIWHMGNEVYFFLKFLNSEMELIVFDRIWFMVSHAILFTALILLVVLLSCAVIAGKSIRKIIS